MKQHIKDLLKNLQSKSSNPNKNAKKEQLKTIGVLTFFVVFGGVGVVSAIQFAAILANHC